MMTVKEVMHNEYVDVQGKETVASVAGKLREANERIALVFDNKLLLGIVSKQGLLRTRLPTHKTTIKNFTKPIASVMPETTLGEAAYLMFNSNSFILPVRQNKKIIGVLKAHDILKRYREFKQIRNYTVKDIAISGAIAVYEDEMIGTAISHMYLYRTYLLPVLNKKNQLSGVISVSDIFKKFMRTPTRRQHGRRRSGINKGGARENIERPKIMQMPIKSFFTKKIIKVKKTHKVSTVADRIIEENILGAIVVDSEGKPEGIVNVMQLLRPIASLHEAPKYNLQFSGLHKINLTPSQRMTLFNISSEMAAKLSHYINNEFILRTTLKAYKQTGKNTKRKKYSVHILIDYPGKKIASSEADWDFDTAIRKAFNNISKQSMHLLRSDSQRNKTYE